MSYIQFPPHPLLTPYIDAYWKVTGHGSGLKTERILPDGCVDMIVNPGEDHRSHDGSFCIKNESVCLVGTMTKYKESVLSPQTHLIGIRFKPGGFSAFYRYVSMHELTDQTVAFDKILFPDILKPGTDIASCLDPFFLNKMTAAAHHLFPVIGHIQAGKGQITVENLSRHHGISPRKMERHFKQHIGVGPKEFINLTRFRHALSLLKQSAERTNLFDIAFECGYYDPAHLTNEIKKYTGSTPSRI